MGLLLTAVAVAIGYLVGSLPIGVLVCRPLGKDPRQVGSGRTGGTNVYRTAGWGPALLTVAGDILKGFVAVAAARAIVPAAAYPEAAAWAVSLAALASILGHNYSPLLAFRGGAGSSPNMGAAIAIDPVLAVIAIVAAALGLGVVRIASVASMSLATVLAVGTAWRVIDGAQPPALLLYGAGQLALIVWALRPNIARLRAGTERRIEARR